MSVVKFPLYNLPNIPECLRKLADDLEAGDEISSDRAVVILESEDNLEVTYKVFGKEPFSVAEAIGLCIIASNLIYETA